MRHRVAVTALACLPLLQAPAAWSQAANACDLNADGIVDLLDVQLGTNMALGTTPCTANILGSNVCNVVVVQRIVNAALNGTCVTGTMHTVTLSWTASTSTNVVGYYVYRGTVAGGPFTKVTSSPVPGTSYTDNAVQSGLTYFYVATAVDSGGNESGNSNQAQAVIPGS